MNSSPSLVIKKQNLHSHSCRSQNSLHFGLGSGLGSYPGGYSTSCRSSAKCQMVLQRWLWYPRGRYEVSQGKSETYSVEGDNAELRHYLARLARKSRCFSRCLFALECALRLFVYCFNSRQLYKQHYPNYPAHVLDFLAPPL